MTVEDILSCGFGVILLLVISSVIAFSRKKSPTDKMPSDDEIDALQEEAARICSRAQTIITRGEAITDASESQEQPICERLFGNTYEAASDSYIVSGRIVKFTSKAWYFQLISKQLKGVAINPVWLPKSMTEIEQAGDIVKMRIVRWCFENRFEKPLSNLESSNFLQACEACGEVASCDNPMEIIDSGQHICHNCRSDMRKG